MRWKPERMRDGSLREPRTRWGRRGLQSDNGTDNRLSANALGIPCIESLSLGLYAAYHAL
jgi:hypothetical protein